MPQITKPQETITKQGPISNLPITKFLEFILAVCNFDIYYWDLFGFWLLPACGRQVSWLFQHIYHIIFDITLINSKNRLLLILSARNSLEIEAIHRILPVFG